MTRFENEKKPFMKAVQALRTKLHGSLLLPDDPDFKKACTLWNRMIDRRPALIAQCTSSQDVKVCIQFAQDMSLTVSVKGGGHNVAGNALSENGLVIDLSRMKEISIDPPAKTAKVEAGVLLGELDKATQAYGLAVPAGIMSETGIGGLTLGGGLGWLSRKFGLTIDNLLEVEIVIANGDVLVVNAGGPHADLFWAVRGGGGNFGVVTSFKFQLHDVGPHLYCGLIFFRLTDAKQIMKYHREFVQTIPNELSAWQVIRKAPPLPFLPIEVHGQPVILTAFCYCGSAVNGEQIMDGYRPPAEIVGKHTGIFPYSSWQQVIDPLQGDGARNYWKSHNLVDLNDACIDVVVNYAANLPSPHTEIFIPHMQGAIAAVSNDATAYGHRQTPFLLNIHGRWETAEEDTMGIKWVKDLFESTRKFSDGSVYVNFISDEGDERVKDAYLMETWKQLVIVKKTYDRENFFRVNQNIRPDHEY